MSAELAVVERPNGNTYRARKAPCELKGYQASGRLGRLSSEQRDWGVQLMPDGVPLAPLPELRRGLLFDVWTPDDWEPIIVPTLTARDRAGAR